MQPEVAAAAVRAARMLMDGSTTRSVRPFYTYSILRNHYQLTSAYMSSPQTREHKFRQTENQGLFSVATVHLGRQYSYY